MGRTPRTVKGEKTMAAAASGPMPMNSGQPVRTSGGGSGGVTHVRLKLEGGSAEGGGEAARRPGASGTGEKRGLTCGAPAQCRVARFEWIQNSQTGSNRFEFKSKSVQTSFDPNRTVTGLKILE
jgi:hypothetical protein